MKLQLQPQLIQPAMKHACLILDRLFAAGFSAYFVGGAVRDTLLQLPIHDIDIATSALPDQVMELFDHCIPTGLQHGTVTVVEDGIHYEVTTFRTEGAYEDHRRPTSVSFVTELELDLRRRDFTMNAMAIDRHFELYDPFMGRKHLSQGILKTVGASKQRFAEDALRMLRAVRFAATYHLDIDSECLNAIHSFGYQLRYVAMERVAYEIQRLLQASDKINAIQTLLDSQLLKYCKSPLNLADRVIDRNRANDMNNNYCWFYLFAIVGMSPLEAAQDMNQLRLSKSLIRETRDVLELISWFEAIVEMNVVGHSHNYDVYIDKIKIDWVHKLIQYSKQSIASFFSYYQTSHQYFKWLSQFHQQLPITHPNQLVVSGRDLMKWKDEKAGPWVKEQIEQLFVNVALGKINNEKDVIRQSLI